MAASHTRLQARIASVFVAGALLLITISTGVPSVGAESCDSSRTGYGDSEDMSCGGSMHCDEDDYAYAEMTASNSGDEVDASASCGTASGSCSGQGQCGQWGALPAAADADDGSCSGNAYTGFYGSADLYCEFGSSASGDVLQMLRDLLQDEMTRSEPSCTTILQVLSMVRGSGADLTEARAVSWDRGVATTVAVTGTGGCFVSKSFVDPIEGIITLQA